MLQGRTLWELIEQRVAATPDAVMIRDENGVTLTFANYRLEAERAAAGLANYGVKEGAVVSWQLPTWIESIVLVAALSRIGAIQNPLLPIYREREVGFISGQAQSDLLIVPSTWNGFGFEEMATGIAAGRSGLDVLVADKALPQGDPASLAAVSTLDGDDPVRWLFYTSGTTSDPKGAQHTDASIAAVGAGMGHCLGLVETDRSALVFPFTHIGGITWLYSALQFGCSLVIMESFHPQRTPEVLSAADVTVAGSGTPFHMAYLAYQRDHDEPMFPHVRNFPGGGAPKPPQLVYDMRETFDAPVLSGYGLTEAPILTMAAESDTDDELAVSEGKPMPGVELHLVKLDGTPAGPGEEGEIRAKAPQLMKGYLDSSLDADAFDDQGYFRTGDLGRLDERGNLIITGRLKDVIIRKGENVSAKEVEDMIYTHPAVADVGVIGVPDAERGEMVCAVVQLAPGVDSLTLPQLADFLRTAGLMVQKLPERLELVDLLPRNPAGKILKQNLKEQYS
jgi:acyl-CoA synthetase (AMP-forming)/AMP-acid ligase II